MDTMDGLSMNLERANLDKLRNLFPECFTEGKLDVKSMNVRTSKKGTATFDMGFIVHGREELDKVIEKVRQLDGVIDIERTAG